MNRLNKAVNEETEMFDLEMEYSNFLISIVMRNQTDSRLSGINRLDKYITEDSEEFGIGDGVLLFLDNDYIEKPDKEHTIGTELI